MKTLNIEMPTINRKKNNVPYQPYKHDSKSLDYYNSKGWKQLRRAYNMSHPLCERCLLKGISRQADEIHHKRFILSGKTDEERWQLLLDPNNLLALCSSCHKELHAIAKRKNLSYCDEHY